MPSKAKDNLIATIEERHNYGQNLLLWNILIFWTTKKLEPFLTWTISLYNITPMF
jgi:hypothetical protein